MTIELATVSRMLPKSHRTLLSQDFLDRIEASVKDSDIADHFKENFISYLGVLTTGKYSMEDYTNAVKYISYKLLGMTNQKAYIATFPDRYERLVNEGKDDDTIACYVRAYNQNKLVIQIYEQTMVPTYVLNAPLHQEALSELAKMIRDPGVRGMAKVKACEAILQYTKQPDVVKGEIKIGIEQQDTIAELREATEGLAAMLQNSLKSKSQTLADVAKAPVIDVKKIEVE